MTDAVLARRDATADRRDPSLARSDAGRTAAGSRDPSPTRGEAGR
ncbi:hypothetical protein [Paracraurococcus lichenis]|uniref:Uncharacterized protein n=1 Tax=Paracraurococcus lichenis TaxID=3064888 RepID=A0ABT9DYU2_9PROT|nr:hypothetical protein [Paracraurococcus sp. LOR1-02]MDO9709053.1 hypothetical protein [Paracraurococcus sp. LOR1-02]